MLPLDGMLVVSIEQAVSAPLATRQLADLGARVIKVERPDGGDFARGYDTSVRGMASHFVWLNRSKESVTLDLKSPAGRAVLDRLVARADVFVQNLAPGAAARLGYDAPTLAGRYPRLVAVDLSGYGGTGPYRDKRAYDLLVQSEGGLVSVTGTPDDPVKTGIPTADIAAGMYIFSGVLAALLRRERGGTGTALEITMFDSTVEWMGHQVQHALHTGEQPRRMGLSHTVIAPYNRYPAKGGEQVLIGVQNDREWRRLAADLIGRPELGTDPRYATNVARTANRDEVDALVAAATATRPAGELIELLDRAGVANARLNELPDVVDHPQLSARDRWREVDSPVGPLRTLLPPVVFDADPPRLGPVPALGEHTGAVLAELGYTPAEIDALGGGAA
ncbi:MAG TPA: CaiB/BaiF CoA-transferase family protein [Actinophytocola sp.]|uniref:CaiB/BaiF CoA transferase family protein n=1 Tax=Actinophytocola sp. TaxID=1872138 RepID=UPI002DB5BF8C|nr:CaiB/BaiF CoA-transferase family protein [Actinophytocola sp.]HEU5469354.1 CaiB/BaiF CoA-transferase family protein [Actinophytocola sp.]